MTRLLIADDHKLFRQGLTHLLAAVPGLTVVAEASSCPEAIEALRAHAIDLAILDLSMPGRGGPDFIAQAKSQHPGLKILVVTMHGAEPYVSQSLRAGADGYLTKEYAAEELIRAIQRVMAGGRYICSAAAERLALEYTSRTEGERPHVLLSEREYKVFEMLVAGRKGCEIADELCLSEKTVSSHKSHVMKKMNVSNRTELVLYAIKHQLIEL